MQETLNDIAGTSTERQKSYVRQIRDFVGEMQNFLVPKLMRRETLKAADYDQIPRFQFQEETTWEIARRVGVGILLLLVPTLLLGGFAFWRLSRYSPLK